jgi:TM2 domain-containing membrane protein YozV
MSTAQNKCPQCGASVDAGARECKYCGEAFAVNVPAQPVVQPQPQVVFVQQGMAQPTSPYSPNWPIKSKVAAGVLAILLGGIGVHKFYMGKIGMGVLYLLLCWTGIPAIIGVIEGIIYLTSNDHNFQIKHRVRLQ